MVLDAYAEAAAGKALSSGEARSKRGCSLSEKYVLMILLPYLTN